MPKTSTKSTKYKCPVVGCRNAQPCARHTQPQAVFRQQTWREFPVGYRYTGVDYVYVRTETAFVREHRLIAAKALGKELPPTSIVHHINGNKHDNSGNNLVLCPNEDYHQLLHRLQEERDADYAILAMSPTF